ncbi:MAG: PLDc N-terminal domain-containing protein [Octadecabacter sp.]
MEYGILGIIVLIANIYALIQVFGSGASTGEKLVWTLLVWLLPVVGFIVWFFAGPRGSAVRI